MGAYDRMRYRTCLAKKTNELDAGLFQAFNHRNAKAMGSFYAEDFCTNLQLLGMQWMQWILLLDT